MAGAASATVSWSAPATGGSPITGYTITVAPGGRNLQVSGSATSATVKGLTPGTAYTFTVTAANALGSGPPSAPSAPVTPGSVPGAWTKAADAPWPAGTLLTLPSGKVLQAVLDESHAHLYDPATNMWSDTSTFKLISDSPTATLLRNGTVLFVGGSGQCGSQVGNYTDCAEIYDPTTDKWTTTGSLITARGYHTATLLQDGRILIVGGVNGPALPGYPGANYLSSDEIYNPSTQQWTNAANLREPRFGQSAILLTDGRVLIVGGYTNADGCANICFDPKAEIYNPKTNTWSAGAPLPGNREESTATLLPNGKVLVAGGFDSSVYPPVFPGAGEVYDPARNTWSPTGNMVTPRAYYTATLLPTGRVLVVAGANWGSMLLSSEVYDLNTNTWQSAADLPGKDVHALASATLLANGQVFVVGGEVVAGYGINPQAHSPVVSYMAPHNGGNGGILSADIYTTVPGAPGNVQATAGIGSATISWSPAPSDGSSITSYTITAAPGGGSVKVRGSATSVTVVGLTSGTSYTFTVTAANAFGSGPPSAPSNSVVPGVSPTPTSPSSAASGTPPPSGGTPSPTANEAGTPTATPGATGTPTATPGPASNPPSNPQPPLLPICLGLLLLILIVAAVVMYLSRSRQNRQETQSSQDSPRT